jgi:hypothetical protein
LPEFIEFIIGLPDFDTGLTEFNIEIEQPDFSTGVTEFSSEVPEFIGITEVIEFHRKSKIEKSLDHENIIIVFIR